MKTKSRPHEDVEEVAEELAAEDKPQRAPFKLDVVFVTSSEKAAEEFRLHVMEHYKPGRVPVGISPVCNTGDAKSGAHVFHLSLPHATDEFVDSLPRLVAHSDSLMWLDYPHAPDDPFHDEPQIYMGRCAEPFA